ncbi:MAG TPA: ATP-binding protein [Desulfuromonadales bacterium]|nr:ATP-binding protein [Desulfuromonadales bacterium]
MENRRVNKALETLQSEMTELHKVEQRLKAVFDSVADPVIAADLGQRLIFINRAAEGFFRLPADSVVGVPLKDAAKEPSLARQLMMAMREEKIGVPSEFSCPAKPSIHPRVYRGTASTIRDESDHRAGLVFVMHDVTRQRNIDRMKNEYLSRAVHDLQTPLTAIIGFSELLATQAPLPDDVHQEAVTVIHHRAEALSRTVDDILDMNRVQTGRDLVLDCQPADLGDVLREAVSCYKDRYEQHRFELQLDSASLQLSMDRRRMRQALSHLLDNCVKFSSSHGGTIAVCGKCTTDGYCVTVADEGIGMTIEQIDNAFEPFYCGDASHGLTGSGLGLSMVKHVVEAHGGRLSIESTAGRGTVVNLHLPA